MKGTYSLAAAICEALGLDATKVTRLELVLSPNESLVRVTQFVGDDVVPASLDKVTKTYELRERESYGQE